MAFIALTVFKNFTSDKGRLLEVNFRIQILLSANSGHSEALKIWSNHLKQELADLQRHPILNILKYV